MSRTVHCDGCDSASRPRSRLFEIPLVDVHLLQDVVQVSLERDTLDDRHANLIVIPACKRTVRYNGDKVYTLLPKVVPVRLSVRPAVQHEGINGRRLFSGPSTALSDAKSLPNSSCAIADHGDLSACTHTPN